MRRPFVVRVAAPDEEKARRLADSLRRAIDARGAGEEARVEWTRDHGADAMSVGLMRAGRPPRWVTPAPLPAAGGLDRALSLLERWGFIATSAGPRGRDS